MRLNGLQDGDHRLRAPSQAIDGLIDEVQIEVVHKHLGPQWEVG